MCGICGIVNLKSTERVDSEQLSAMRDILFHRGPDDEGLFIEPEAGFGFRRLAILDLSERGRQPYFSDDKNYVLIYNGEIYNFRELRSELQKEGVSFQSESDTEVLLKLYIRRGKKMLNSLNGMFAFAIWNKREKTFFAARDRLGVKPFYYACWKGKFLFASEQKALLKAGVPKDIQEEALNEFLLYRYVAGEDTLIKSIRKLLPGHYIEIKNGEVKIEQWWKLHEIIAAKNNAPESPNDWFETTFDSAVAYRMISDVPVGILLSGGLDSSNIAASLAYQKYSSLSTFTIRFPNENFDESPLAKVVASEFGFLYHDLEIENCLPEMLKLATWHLDEPLAHQNDPYIFAISKKAKQSVTVLLSGEGGDETLGGYVRYKALNHALYLKQPISWLNKALNLTDNNGRFGKLIRYFSAGDTDALVLLNACSLYPADFTKLGITTLNSKGTEYRRKVLQEAKNLYPTQPIRQAMYLDLFTYLSSLLDRNDKMTMGASIECRVPFLDYRLVEGIGKIKTNHLIRGKKGKYPLWCLGSKRLPQAILKFKKWGLGVPWGKYLKQMPEFADDIDKMSKNPAFELGIFKHLNIPAISKEFMKNGEHELLFRHLFMFHCWVENYHQKF